MSHFEPTLDDPILLLRESDWLRRLARGLCSDAGLAEDLSQDTMLIAWQSRGIAHGPLRPWLSGVLRRLAANRQRAQARRRRREAAAATERHAPAADAVVVRAGLHRSVVDAVMELDEPYRTAILLRYFDDLPAREIAARLKVPVETVRTRIKRGVAMLRSRLDREHGERMAWTGSLLATSEMSIAAAGFGAGTLALVGLLMQTKILVPLCLICGIGAFYFWPDGMEISEGPVPATAAAHPTEHRAAIPAVVEVTSPTTEPEPRSVVAAAALTIRGRLLAESTGAGVAGAIVSVIDAKQMRATGEISIEHSRTIRPLKRATSLPDGRYSIELATTLPVQFAVLVVAAGYAPLLSQARMFGPGSTLDLGDAMLHRSVEISGRVRDVDDQAVAGLTVRLGWRGQFGDTDTWVAIGGGGGRVVTDADGRFAMPRSGREGTYWITFDDSEVRLVQETLAFRKVTPENSFLDLVIDKQLGELRGVVVDPDGKPVRGLRIHTADGLGYSTSDDQGGFVLVRRRGTTAEVGLRVWRARFKRSEVVLSSARQFRWGDKNVRLVVPRGVDLQLQVVQAPEMEPVEIFELDMQRVGARTWAPGGIPRGSGTNERHAGGWIKIPDMVPGRYCVLVVQRDRSVVVQLEVRHGEGGRLRLVLPATESIRIELVDGSGNPVAGSRVDLLRPGPEKPHSILPLQPKMRTDARGGVTGVPLPRTIYRVAGGKSDARGCVDLPIPEHGELVLRVFGSDHAPLLRRGDLRPRSGVLRLTLRRGVRLSGKIVPRSLVRELHAVSLCLESLRDPGVVFPARFTHLAPGRPGSIVQPDGSFALDNVPAGKWRVHLSYLTRGRGSAAIYQLIPVTTVELRAGKACDIDLECGGLASTRVEGQALFRDAPARFARLDLSGPRVLGQTLSGTFDCDKEGRFAGHITPGTYEVKAVVRDPKSGRDVACTFAGRLTVRPGVTVFPMLDLEAVPPDK